MSHNSLHGLREGIMTHTHTLCFYGLYIDTRGMYILNITIILGKVIETVLLW